MEICIYCSDLIREVLKLVLLLILKFFYVVSIINNEFVLIVLK